MHQLTIKAVVLATLAALASPPVASAIPPMPLTLWGAVRIDGANVPLDTVITTWCAVAQAGVPETPYDYNGVSFYDVAVPGDDAETPEDEGCLPGETVTFKVGALWATQTLPWEESAQALDLSAWTASQPAAITDLHASIEAGPLLGLDWTSTATDVFGDPISGVTYNIYRGQDAPYFTLVSPYDEGTGGPPYLDLQTNVIGNTLHNFTYIVTPVDMDGREGLPSSRVAVFSFSLVPGG